MRGSNGFGWTRGSSAIRTVCAGRALGVGVSSRLSRSSPDRCDRQGFSRSSWAMHPALAGGGALEHAVPERCRGVLTHKRLGHRAGRARAPSALCRSLGRAYPPQTGARAQGRLTRCDSSSVAARYLGRGLDHEATPPRACRALEWGAVDSHRHTVSGRRSISLWDRDDRERRCLDGRLVLLPRWGYATAVDALERITVGNRQADRYRSTVEQARRP
jgi:hypothetical protein